MRIQQLADCEPKRMVVATCTVDKRITLPGLMGQGVLEDSGDLPPPFGRHARGASVNRVYSRTRTTCHPRSTVALEILGASAVSPTESPPDNRTSATRLFRESHDASSISASSRHGEKLPAVPALQARSTPGTSLSESVRSASEGLSCRSALIESSRTYVRVSSEEQELGCSIPAQRKLSNGIGPRTWTDHR